MAHHIPQGRLDQLSDAQLLDLRGHVDTALSKRGTKGLGAPPGGALPACRLFSVSEGVRRLDKPQIEALARSFAQWVEDSRDERTRRSRERVLIVFQVLRYTGARLGEVLALNEGRDVDFERGVVAFAGAGNPEQAREVPLPSEVVERLKKWCDDNDSGVSGGRGEGRLFDLDQGFLRRKFQEQEGRSGLPRELLNPRVLRNSRAVELLQGGMPLRAVQALLGHAKADFTAAYVTLESEDLKNVIRQYCSKEFGGATSARNTFSGAVASIASTPVKCSVVLRTDAGYEVEALLTSRSRDTLGLAEGRQATALVKATWAVLQKPGQEPPEGTNAFPGTITHVAEDQDMAEVRGELGDGTPVCALIPAKSFQALGMGPGDPFVFSFSPLSVIIR